jgi:hypothetical protein
MSESLLFSLVGVRNWDALELVTVMADDVLLSEPHNDDELFGAEFHELLESMGEDGFVSDFHHPLRFVLGEGPETGPFACGEHDCLHGSPLRARCSDKDEE